jgi:hypothetical protein
MDNAGPFAGAHNPYRSSSSSSPAAAAGGGAVGAVSGEEKQASVAANKAQYEDEEWLQRWVIGRGHERKYI